MKLRSVLFVLAAAFSWSFAAESVGPTLAQGQARLLRHPTYHNGHVAFSYLGDLWVARDNGSELRRLTDHQARDIYPRYSPNGALIAFSSKRDGNLDVFVVPAAGGKARQLTYHTADDTVVGWTPDGRKIIFASARNQGAFPSVTTLFEVPVDGGMEQPVPTDWGSWASYSADGRKLAFTRHPGSWSRQHQRGSYVADLWVMDVAARKFTALVDPDYKGNQLWPMYARNGDIYFVADRLPNEKNIAFGPELMKSVNNLWKVSDQGGKPVQVTQHTSGHLVFPSMSADGKTIVYEQNFGLWKLDVASGRSTEIRVTIPSDVKDNEVVLRTIQSEADAFSLSPSTKRAAISARGEIFTIATDRGEVQRVTETFWREQHPRWSPDGKRIAFISDRTGREEIWVADERGENLKQLTDLDSDKSTIAWAPDSQSILWTSSDRKLRRTQIADGTVEEITSSDVGPVTGPQFSPDGKWISYAKPDKTLRSHVYVRPADGGEERMIGADAFLISSDARWTPDGKKLLLLGGAGAPGMASLNRTTMQLYSVALTPIEKDPNDRDIDTEEEAQAADAAARARPTGSGTGSAKPVVKIDWGALDRRIKQISRVGGSVVAVAPSPDSRTYAFATSAGDDDGGRPAIYTIAEDGSRLTMISQGVANTADDAPTNRTAPSTGFAEPQWSKDGRTLYYRQGNGLYSVAVSSSPSDTPPASSAARTASAPTTTRPATPSPTTAAASSTPTPRRLSFSIRVEIDEAAQRRQVFEEAWRVMKHRFYDPAMHGVDWAAAKAKYQPLLANIADSDELHALITQMIGELNASHTGVSGGSSDDRGERVQTRYPGFDLEPDASGFYKISHVYAKGPADHDYVRLSVGNYIFAVNGRALKTSDNYWKMFNVIPGRKFEFVVGAKPERTETWEVTIEPVSSTAQGTLEYERWVNARKAMVAKLSDGEIGYLHIRSMNAPSYRKFQRDLLDNIDKKALIIDQRFNGGGGIDQELLEILNRRVKYQSWRRRDSIVEVPRPVQAFYGPMVVMQNERSASNAEMFPDGFRKLGLGKVIGVTTMGAVIGTSSYRLLDGSSIRTPGVGVFTASGQNMENYGVPPDIHVDNTPDDFLQGRDRQIEKAVEVLRADLKSAPRSVADQ